jgi:hypothetical protein
MEDGIVDLTMGSNINDRLKCCDKPFTNESTTISAFRSRSVGSRVLMEEAGTHIVRVKILGLTIGTSTRTIQTKSESSNNNINNLENSVAIASILINNVVHGPTNPSNTIQIDLFQHNHIPSLKNRTEDDHSCYYSAVWDVTKKLGSSGSDVLIFETQLLENDNCDIVVGLLPPTRHDRKRRSSKQTEQTAFPFAIAQLDLPSKLLLSGKRIVDLPLRKYDFNTNPFASPKQKTNSMRLEEITDDGDDVEVSILSPVSATNHLPDLYDKTNESYSEEKKEEMVCGYNADENFDTSCIDLHSDSILRIEVEVLEKETNVEIGFGLPGDSSFLQNNVSIEKDMDSDDTNFNGIDSSFRRSSDIDAFEDEVMKLTTKLLAVDPSIERVLSKYECDNSNKFTSLSRNVSSDDTKHHVKRVSVIDEETERTMTDAEGDDDTAEEKEINAKQMADAASLIVKDLNVSNNGNGTALNSRVSSTGKRHGLVGSQTMHKLAKNLLTVPKEFKRISSKRPQDELVVVRSNQRTVQDLGTNLTSQQSKVNNDTQVDPKSNYLRRLGILKRRPPKANRTGGKAANCEQVNHSPNDVHVSSNVRSSSRTIVDVDCSSLKNQELNSDSNLSNHRVGSVVNTEVSVATTPAGNLKKRIESTGSLSDSLSISSSNVKLNVNTDSKSIDTIDLNHFETKESDDGGVVSPSSEANDELRVTPNRDLPPSDFQGQQRSLPTGLIKPTSFSSLQLANNKEMARNARSRSEATLLRNTSIRQLEVKNDSGLLRSQSLASEDRAVNAAINEANKTLQEDEMINQIDCVVPLPDEDTKVPLDLVVNLSKIKSDFKVSKAKINASNDNVPTQIGISQSKSLDLMSTDESVHPPAICEFKPSLDTSFGFNFNPCMLNLFGGDEDYSDDETWTQIESLRSFNTLHDDRFMLASPFCRSNVVDDLSQIYSKSVGSKKPKSRSVLLQCITRPTDTDSISHNFSLDSFDRFALQYGGNESNDNYEEQLADVEENDDASSSQSSSVDYTNDESMTRDLSRVSKDGDSKLSLEKRNKNKDLSGPLSKNSEFVIKAVSGSKNSEAIDRESTSVKRSPSRSTTGSNRSSSEFDKSYSKHISVEDTNNPSSTPRNGSRKEFVSSESNGNDDGSPHSVLDSISDHAQSKPLSQSFKNFVSRKSSNSSKVGKYSRGLSGAIVPCVLQTQEEQSVGDLTATTHEMQVEIEQFKLQIQAMESQLEVRTASTHTPK